MHNCIKIYNKKYNFPGTVALMGNIFYLIQNIYILFKLDQFLIRDIVFNYFIKNKI